MILPRESKTRFVAFFSPLIYLLSQQPALGGERIARLMHPHPNKKIQNLQWKNEEIEIESTANGKDFDLVAIVEGTFKRAEWNLLLGTQQIPTQGPDGAFVIKIPIKDPEQKFDLLAVSPLGELEREESGISFPEMENYLKGLKGVSTPTPVAADPAKVQLSAGFGLSYLSFLDSRVGPLTEMAITPKLGFNRQIFNPSWDIGGNIYYNLIPFASSMAGATAQFFGWNLRGGWVIPKIPQPWRVALYVGYYYTTMNVPTNNFGFTGMSGPQLFPTGRYTFKNGHSLSAYFKFSPVTNGLALLTLTNREIAGGLGYTFKLKSPHAFLEGHPITINLDVSNMALVIQGVTLSATTITLGGTFGFELKDISWGKINF